MSEPTNAPFSPIELKIRGNMNGIKFPCIAEKKLDGVFVTVLVKDGAITAVTKGGRSRSMTLVSQPKGYKEAVFIGEAITKDGDVNELYKTLEKILSPVWHVDIACFDVMSIDGRSVHNLPLIDRLEIIGNTDVKSMSDYGQSIINDQSELDAFIEDGKKKNWEGIVVKNLDEPFSLQKWVKIKNVHEEELYCCSFGSARPADICVCELGNGKTQDVPVLTKISEEAFSTGLVTVRHFGRTPEGMLRNPCVIEVKAKGAF